MKTLLLALLIASGPAFAADKCYQDENDPTARVVVKDLHEDPEAPEMVWTIAGRTVNLGTAGAGTGGTRRYAFEMDSSADPTPTYGYVYVDNALVLDYGVYRLGCK